MTFTGTGEYQGQPVTIVGISEGGRTIVFVVAATDCTKVLASISLSSDPAGPGSTPGIRVRSFTSRVAPRQQEVGVSDWTTQAADAVEKGVVLVRDKTVVPAQQGVRYVVYGFLTAFFALTAFMLVTILAVPGPRHRGARLGRVADRRGNLPHRRRVLLDTPLEERSRKCLSFAISSSSVRVPQG